MCFSTILSAKLYEWRGGGGGTADEDIFRFSFFFNNDSVTLTVQTLYMH